MIPGLPCSCLCVCRAIFRVKLAVNRDTQEAIAVKIIDHDKVNEGVENVRKEVRLAGKRS